MVERIGFVFFLALAFMAQVTEADARRHRHKKTRPAAIVTQPVDAVEKAAALKASFAQAIEEQPGYVATLGELDAEVQVALALYQTAHVSTARAHISHSDGVLYRRLINRVLARRAKGFSNELNAFTKAVATGQTYKSVQKKYALLKTAIGASRGEGELLRAVPMVTAVSLLTHKSADYFNSGVGNGAVIEPSQYQEAWGFMKAAKSIMADIPASERRMHAADLKEIDAALLDLNRLWPTLTSQATNPDGPQILSEAAAKVDAVLLRLN